MPTSVPMMPDAGNLAGENLLYIIQGSGTDRDRKITLAELREYCTAQGVALYELNTASASNLVLPLALGSASTSAFVVVSGTGRNTYTLNISGSVPAGCQINVLMMASGALKVASTDATINGIDPALELTSGDATLLGRGTGTVWWGSATRSAANTDAAVLAEHTRAEAEEQALSQAIAAEASTRGAADTALGTRITGITSKAVELDLKDADVSTGVLSLDVSSYGSDLLVQLVNSTSANPPASPGYFTLQIAGSLPAGASLRVANSMGSVEGETLNVKISFTEPFTYGIGTRTLSGMALLPLLSRAFFKAVVAPDGQTWLGDSVDNLAVPAFLNNQTKIVSTSTAYSAATGIAAADTVLSFLSIDVPAGSWLIDGTANFLVANATGGVLTFWMRLSAWINDTAPEVDQALVTSNYSPDEAADNGAFTVISAASSTGKAGSCVAVPRKLFAFSAPTRVHFKTFMIATPPFGTVTVFGRMTATSVTGV